MHVALGHYTTQNEDYIYSVEAGRSSADSKADDAVGAQFCRKTEPKKCAPLLSSHACGFGSLSH